MLTRFRVGGLWVGPSTWTTFQAPTPAVGFLDVTTLPFPSTATHSLLVGQETPFKKHAGDPPNWSHLEPIWVTFQAAAPPVGLVEVTTLPLPSTSTQKPVVGQDTPLGPKSAEVTCVTFQEGAPPVGLVEVTTLSWPTATQRSLLGQDTLERPLDGTLLTLQAVAPPVGLVDMTTSPRSFTTMQSPVLGQETPDK